MNSIYGLHLEGEERIRYVGQTTRSVDQRLAEHLAAKNRKLPVSKWTTKHGDRVRLSLLESELRVDELDGAEVAWITALGTHVSQGGLNVTTGGGGVRGYVPSAETRRKTSERMKGEKHPRWGAVNSPLMRKRISEALQASKSLRGEGNPNAVLNCEQVLDIFARRTAGESSVLLAAEYGISANQVSFIHLGKGWRDVTGVSLDPDRGRRERAVRHLKRDIQRAVERTQRPPRRLSDETKAKIGMAHRGMTAKIGEEEVRAIKARLRAGERGMDLAMEFGVHKATVSDIKLGKTWAWVDA